MLEDVVTELRQPFAYWLIVTPGPGQPEVLTIDRGSGKVLPVFSFEEEAGLFLKLGGFERDCWRLAESTAGHLASVLVSEPCASIESVVLDPLPEAVEAILDTDSPPLTLSRQSFLALPR